MEVFQLVILQKYTLLEFTLHNEFAEHKSTTFQVKPQINFNVFPRKEKQPMVGDMTVEVGSMDDDSPMYLKVKMRGHFLPIAQNQDDALMDIKEFHKQAFPLLFDVVCTFMAGTTLMGGMTPFSLPPIDPNRLNFEKKE